MKYLTFITPNSIKDSVEFCEFQAKGIDFYGTFNLQYLNFCIE